MKNPFYWFIYTTRPGIWMFDRQWVVEFFLRKHYAKAAKAVNGALGHLKEGDEVFQVGATFGDQSRKLAEAVQQQGGKFRLLDVSAHEARNAHEKLHDVRDVTVALGDVTQPIQVGKRKPKVGVLFFLEHELPLDDKPVAVRNMLTALDPKDPDSKLVMADFARPEGKSRSLKSRLDEWFHRILFSFAEREARPMLKHRLGDWLPADMRKDWKAEIVEQFDDGLYEVVQFVPAN